MKLNQTFKICTKCDYFCNSLEQDKFCSICGTELIESCPKCGKEIKNPYANFCRYCGEKYPGRKTVTNNKSNK